MKFLQIIFIFLFSQINSENYEINKIFPDILQRIPVYSRVDAYIYFESNNFTSNDIYLYLEDKSNFISYTNICYTNEDPILSSTIDNCTFDEINPYKKDYYFADQKFYKFPKNGKYIIIKYKAGYPGVLKAQIANHDLVDDIKDLYEDPLPPLTIAVIVLGGALFIGIALIIILFCYIDKQLHKTKRNQRNNESNAPLNQPEVINQDIQNQEHTQTPIINNE